MTHLQISIFLFISMSAVACSSNHAEDASRPLHFKKPVQSNPTPGAARNSFPVIHVFVALCDNVNQGIVPVSPSLGNGDNPATNLYWGAAFGVKTFFKGSRDWEFVAEIQNPQPTILERCIFKHRARDAYLVADAYRGKEIKQATIDFLEAASGKPGEEFQITRSSKLVHLNIGGSGDLLVYVGHNGLMDFPLPITPRQRDARKREAIILACVSKLYFSTSLKSTGASPLVWTTNLMAPEAYVLSAAIDGWIMQEPNEQIRLRAATAYDKYQNCGLKSANRLFATGW